MRHRRKGRVLGRSPSHQRALLRNLASALLLTERETEAGEIGAAKVAGRIVTTLAKAKEVRPLVERCAVAPAVKARRRVIRLLGDKQAARILFERVAPRFVDRPGGYTRILKLATPRLGDAGPRAIIEFVGAEASSAAPAPRVERASAT